MWWVGAKQNLTWREAGCVGLCRCKSGFKCDRACENRACGIKYTMSFDETYLNTEM